MGVPGSGPEYEVAGARNPFTGWNITTGLDNSTCKVLDNHEVEFEGEKMSLTKSALIIIKRLGYPWDKIAGSQYWMYEDETLYHRENRVEAED